MLLRKTSNIGYVKNLVANESRNQSTTKIKNLIAIRVSRSNNKESQFYGQASKSHTSYKLAATKEKLDSSQAVLDSLLNKENPDLIATRKCNSYKNRNVIWWQSVFNINKAVTSWSWPIEKNIFSLINKKILARQINLHS